LAVGDRAPDAALAGGRLFEVLRGPQFTLLAFGERAGVALRDVPWPATGAALHRHQVTAPDGGAAVRGAYGIGGDALVLVRPDGYIGHIAHAGRQGPGRERGFDLGGLARAVESMTPH
jgi:hypothetical protein